MIRLGRTCAAAMLLAAIQSTTLFAADPVTAPSHISAVTIYQTNALVTREVDVPAAAGATELVVGPLPPSTVNSSLYSEGDNALRVLTTRFRTRVVQENTQEEVRKLEDQLKDLARQQQATQESLTVTQNNIAFLAKLENFTGASLQQLTEKGMLNSDVITKLAGYIMETRQLKSKELVASQQQIQDLQEKQQFLQREMAKVSSGSDKTIREAVIVVDNEKGQAGKVHLNYLVTAASWHPQYKLRAAQDKPEVQLEYLAAINQQTGEDWNNVEMVLSTAMPMLNAAPPELSMLDVNTGPMRPGMTVTVNGNALDLRSEMNFSRARQFREEGQSLYNSAKKQEAERRFNDAAAYQQSDEILNAQVQQAAQAKPSAPAFREGQSVTFHLDQRKLSVPWRDDEQLIEVTRIPLKPDYFYKAVPVLTPHVYRLANLTNDSKFVILPGEATTYVGTDFVGRAQLPLVAIGEQFTAGFGVDPQLQVSRQLVDKSKSIQGGNQVLKFDYRLTVSSYKNESVKLQLWDRLPHPETDAVNVMLVQSSKETSMDPAYIRDDKPKNLLRWDLTVDPTNRGEKAQTITYQFKMEFAKDATIGNFLSK